MARAKSKLAKDLEREKRRLEKKRLSARAKAQLLFNLNCYHDQITYDIVFTRDSDEIIFNQLKIEFSGDAIPMVWANREYGEVINRYVQQIPDVTYRYAR
jgi:hypothetical protein